MEIKFNLPKIKPIWVAWVTGQFLFLMGFVISKNATDALSLFVGMSGFIVMVNCGIARIPRLWHALTDE